MDIERLLVIAPFYRFYIKHWVEALSKYIEEIVVLVHYNPLVELSKIMPVGGYIDWARLFTKENLIDTNSIPQNVKIQVVPMYYLSPDGRNKRLGDLATKKFIDYLKKENINFDIVHGQFRWPSGYAAINIGKYFNIPKVVTIHGLGFYYVAQRGGFWLKIMKYILSEPDHIIASSNNTAKYIKRICHETPPITVIPNGFNPTMFYPIPQERARETLGLPVDRKIIVCVGNLAKIKGQHILVNAMKYVIKKRQDVLCVLVGDGQLKKDLKKLIKKLNLQEYVFLAGKVPHHEVPLWMNSANIFVLPSLSEGNPTVMFEALGCGVPFVGTRVGGVPEIITSNEYGLLVDPGSPEDLAEKIMEALDLNWDREKIHEYAQKFTWDRIARETLKVYKKVLGD